MVTFNSNLFIGKDNERELKKLRKYEINMGETTDAQILGA